VNTEKNNRISAAEHGFFIGKTKPRFSFPKRKMTLKSVFHWGKVKKVINTPMTKTVENILHSPIALYIHQCIFEQTLNKSILINHGEKS